MKRKRVAGIMRVKNEGMFIHDCVESCIDALDELIIVYNDCTDNSAEEIKKIAEKYPNKIRYYAYPYEVRAFNLSQKEFKEIKNYPEDNPHLFSAYSNFALSKVTADYALKIDADQVYFTNKLKEWCDFIRDCEPMRVTLKIYLGKVFKYYLSAYRYISLKFGGVISLMPSWLLKVMYPAYIEWAKYAFSHDEAAMALSGINVLETDETLVSMGHPSKILLLLPPFNGVGDTIMFKMSDKVHFQKLIMDEYNTNTSDNFIVAEEFVHPYKTMSYIGYFWKHVRTMRPGVREAALKAYSLDKEAFLDIDSFQKLSYRKILKHSPKTIFFPFYRILFEFIYKSNKNDLFYSLENESFGQLKKD